MPQTLTGHIPLLPLLQCVRKCAVKEDQHTQEFADRHSTALLCPLMLSNHVMRWCFMCLSSYSCTLPALENSSACPLQRQPCKFCGVYFLKQLHVALHISVCSLHVRRCLTSGPMCITLRAVCPSMRPCCSRYETGSADGRESSGVCSLWNSASDLCQCAQPRGKAPSPQACAEPAQHDTAEGR
jgi:hypothetical protein